MTSKALIHKTLSGVGATATLLGAVLVPAHGAGATGTAPATAAEDCVVSNPDDYNNRSWLKLSDPYGKGEATFSEYDEMLVVEDHDSDGTRVDVELEWCWDGEWRYFGSYTSGPDEGSIDKDWYDLEFMEGRRVRFKVCAWNQQEGYPFNCTDAAIEGVA